MAARKSRIRRKPEEARALILDAAEKSMAADGPAGIRLQDIARTAGVSHPTILHHFGSREGLVQALNLRTLEDLKKALIGGMKASNGDDGIALSFAVYRNGLAQRMVWLLQSVHAAPHGSLDVFEGIVKALHETRLGFARPGHIPDIADTRNVVHLVTVAALGDALIGARLRREDGEKERQAGARFEKWFSDLITQFLSSKA